ncbi:flavin-binding monooxygenase-like protein [Aspergillus stella-maris]|uniref:flavin-binding monooxygenase-like protein n=1 Tax=Aspergillus stella-maris TaxID=1810926 RepID=UPI003CCE4848
MEELDLLVIGAGWSGLAALKTYRQVNPSASTCLLEYASSVGGVWATHRLWDGLKSNNLYGTYSYSDFPMDESFGVKENEHIPGHIIQLYLERYANHFGIMDSIRLNSKVTLVEHNDNTTWTITYTDTATEKEIKIHTRKLILATGITSQPYLPPIEGQESFNRPLFHTVDMPKYHESTITQPTHRIAVLGGTKSAWDAVYAAASSGAKVEMIIRDNGHGPCWMAPPYVTPLHKWLEKLVTTRLLTWFSPCIWADPTAEHGAGTRARNFLHGTWLGRKITDVFWSVLGNDVVALNKFNSHPELKKLQPWISPFWVASGLSILNYPTNFFDLVTEGKVTIHIDHITHLSEGTIHLANGEPLTDISALVMATGWTPTPNIQFNPPSLMSQLGYPTATDPLPSSLISVVDKEILRRFPRLANRPTHDSPSKYEPLASDAQTETQSLHAYRLTRFMVPASTLARERSAAFAGVAMTINTPLLAQTEALWITAFFNNKINLQDITSEICPDDLVAVLKKTTLASASTSTTDDAQAQAQANVLYETALHTQFGYHRYPGGLGRRNPDFVFDAVPYLDMLLRDLGLCGDRKRKGWRGWFESYGGEDYRGVVEEWIGLQGDEGEGVGKDGVDVKEEEVN